jgi:hypothetical protein
MPNTHSRLRSDSGIAIGVILFVIALIAVISIAMGASGNFMGSTITPDRVTADIKSQANLIRNKILECFTNGYDRGDLPDRYPSSTGTGTLVEALDCPSYGAGQTSMWMGQSAATLPPPTGGFDKWVYVNAGASGGRCIRIQPSTGNTTNEGIKNGLIQASSNFSAMELTYDSNGASQRFILWITRPSGTPSADCTN